jgi:hypothetical protein
MEKGIQISSFTSDHSSLEIANKVKKFLDKNKDIEIIAMDATAGLDSGSIFHNVIYILHKGGIAEIN